MTQGEYKATITVGFSVPDDKLPGTSTEITGAIAEALNSALSDLWQVKSVIISTGDLKLRKEG